MEGRTGFDRAAATILAVVGVSVVGWVVVAVVDSLPALASDNPPQRDGALFGLIVIGIPVVVGGLVTLLVGRRLWRGHPRARALGLAWVAAAGLAASLTSSFGTVPWAVRTMVLYPDALSIRWPYLFHNPFNDSTPPDGSPVVGTPIEQLPSVRLDTLYFWLPGIVMVGALAVAGLLLASWIARRARRAHPG